MLVVDEGVQPGKRIPRGSARRSGFVEQHDVRTSLGEAHRDRCADDTSPDDADLEMAATRNDRKCKSASGDADDALQEFSTVHGETVRARPAHVGTQQY